MSRLAFPVLPGGPGVAALVIRSVVGPVLAYHGYRKIDGGVDSFVNFVRDQVDVPLPTLVSYAVVVIELVGGLCLLIGLLTRLWALLVAVQMLAITFIVKGDLGLIAPAGGGPGFELDLVIGAAALALFLIGPGPSSLDRVLGVDGREPDRAAA